MAKQGNRGEFRAYALGEILLILLPFLVLTIVFAFQQKLSVLLYQPEFSLTSSVISGQIIIKLIHLTGKAQNKKSDVKVYSLGAFIAILIVFSLVPSLIFFSILATTSLVPQWIILLQILIFVATLYIFFAISMVQAEIEEDVRDSEQSDSQ